MKVTRRYRFSASHRLHSPSLSEEENCETYGKCNNPYGHGHNYILEVSVRGHVEAETGRVASIGKLDGFVLENVLTVLDHKDLNTDVEGFATLVPTTENLAVVVDGLLRADWRKSFPNVDLAGVRLEETERNSFELRAQ